MDKVNIGSVTLEIQPEKQIEFTSGRQFAKYDIPGSLPTYQDMGEQERTCKFDGAIHEENALEKAKAIQKVQDSGLEIKFIYGSIDEKVVIRSFSYKYLRSDYVRYSIELLQVSAKQEGTVNAAPALDAQKQSALIKTTEQSGMTAALAQVSTTKQPILQGDCLRTIASRLCGSPDHWTVLAALNGLTGVDLGGLNFLKIPSGVIDWDAVCLVMDAQAKKLPAEAYRYEDGGRGV